MTIKHLEPDAWSQVSCAVPGTQCIPGAPPGLADIVQGPCRTSALPEENLQWFLSVPSAESEIFAGTRISRRFWEYPCFRPVNYTWPYWSNDGNDVRLAALQLPLVWNQFLQRCPPKWLFQFGTYCLSSNYWGSMLKAFCAIQQTCA